MASPGELIDIISAVTGIPRPRVFSGHRYLREAHLVTQGGRGPSAAKMSARDAAHILIAACSSAEIKDSASAIERPGGLVSAAGQWRPSVLSIPELLELPANHSFADALEALIASASSGTLQRAFMEMEQGQVDLIHDPSPATNIEVTIYGPTPRGAILLEKLVTDEQGAGHRNQENSDRHFYGNLRAEPGSGDLAWYDISTPRELDSDLQTSATFSHRTIAAIGKLLARSNK